MGRRAGAGAGRPRRSCPAKGEAGGYKGIAYLHRTQETDGSWGHYPATTALALSGLLRNGKTEANDPAVARGVQFLVKSVQPNGAIFSNANPAMALPNYNTCLAVMALTETKNPVFKPAYSQGAAVSGEGAVR